MTNPSSAWPVCGILSGGSSRGWGVLGGVVWGAGCWRWAGVRAISFSGGFGRGCDDILNRGLSFGSRCLSAVVNFVCRAGGCPGNKPGGVAGGLKGEENQGPYKGKEEEGQECFYYALLDIACCGNEWKISGKQGFGSCFFKSCLVNYLGSNELAECKGDFRG